MSLLARSIVQEPRSIMKKHLSQCFGSSVLTPIPKHFMPQMPPHTPQTALPHTQQSSGFYWRQNIRRTRRAPPHLAQRSGAMSSFFLCLCVASSSETQGDSTLMPPPPNIHASVVESCKTKPIAACVAAFFPRLLPLPAASIQLEDKEDPEHASGVSAK